jgi:NAD(P)-dependent dehydrogenase (short-subunit alcohol dehydrogenase family)
VVTGGSRGIGRAVAIRLASEGCDLALVARDVDGVRLGRSLAGTVEEIERLGRRVAAIGCDLTDPSVRRESIIDRVEAELGGVDILVNNAAMSVFKSVSDWTDEKLRAMQIWAVPGCAGDSDRVGT